MKSGLLPCTQVRETIDWRGPSNIFNFLPSYRPLRLSRWILDNRIQEVFVIRDDFLIFLKRILNNLWIHRILVVKYGAGSCSSQASNPKGESQLVAG